MPSWVVLGLLAAVFAALVAILGKVGVRDSIPPRRPSRPPVGDDPDPTNAP